MTEEVDYDVDSYAQRLEMLLDEKLDIFSKFKERLTKFRNKLTEEEMMSKKFGKWIALFRIPNDFSIYIHLNEFTFLVITIHCFNVLVLTNQIFKTCIANIAIHNCNYF